MINLLKSFQKNTKKKTMIRYPKSEYIIVKKRKKTRINVLKLEDLGKKSKTLEYEKKTKYFIYRYLYFLVKHIMIKTI